MGTHESTRNNFDYINAGVEDNKTFRLLVQNCIYELSDVVLKIGGFLHIVDRGEVPYNAETIKIVIDSHKDQASVTSLIVDENIKYLEYEPIDNSIRMIKSSIGDRESIPKRIAFISVLSKK